MQQFFEWVSRTPFANLVLILALGVLVLILIIATALSVIAFFKHVPFEFFTFKVWTNGLACQTGTQDLNIPPDWNNFQNLQPGQPGDRTLTTTIKFTPDFIVEPKVLVSLSKIDVESIARIRLEAVNITPKGFMLRYGTWQDTKIYQLTISWIAIGR
jgi:hypothetical protein